jgi:hypothetical protein
MAAGAVVHNVDNHLLFVGKYWEKNLWKIDFGVFLHSQKTAGSAGAGLRI